MDLDGGTLPVCGGECKECECVNADARCSLDDAACRFRSCPMAGRTRQAPRSGPSSIAVRNDRYVKPRRLGDDWLHRGNLPNCELRHEHVLSPPRRKYRKLLCNVKYKAKIFLPSALACRANQRFHVIQIPL